MYWSNIVFILARCYIKLKTNFKSIYLIKKFYNYTFFDLLKLAPDTLLYDCSTVDLYNVGTCSNSLLLELILSYFPYFFYAYLDN